MVQHRLKHEGQSPTDGFTCDTQGSMVFAKRPSGTTETQLENLQTHYAENSDASLLTAILKSTPDNRDALDNTGFNVVRAERGVLKGTYAFDRE